MASDQARKDAYPTEEELTNPNVTPPTRDYGWTWCEKCGRWMARGGPDHDPSPRCQSGKRPHCTCDTCF